MAGMSLRSWGRSLPPRFLTSEVIAFMVLQGWNFSELMEMPASDIKYWYIEAEKLYKKMHPSDGG